MSRALAFAMTRPHERLGLHQPIGRRLPQGLAGWNLLITAAMVLCVVGYVFQVNSAASRGFGLRDVEKRVDTLQSDVMVLEDKVATLSSVQSLSERAAALGFVLADRLEYVNPAGKAYAMR
jgi:hypothetical protein